jgi:hypothetical protein
MMSQYSKKFTLKLEHLWIGSVTQPLTKFTLSTKSRYINPPKDRSIDISTFRDIRLQSDSEPKS